MEKSRREMEAAVRRQKCKERMERNKVLKELQSREFQRARRQFKSRINSPAKPKYIEMEKNYLDKEASVVENRKRILGMIK